MTNSAAMEPGGGKPEKRGKIGFWGPAIIVVFMAAGVACLMSEAWRVLILEAALVVSPFVWIALLTLQRRWRLVRAAAIGGLIALVPIGAWAWPVAIENSRLGNEGAGILFVVLWFAALAAAIIGVLLEVLLGRFVRPKDAAEVLRKAGAK